MKREMAPPPPGGATDVAGGAPGDARADTPAAGRPDGGRRLRILYATAEEHPTHRVDVRVLFGQALPAAGVAVDLVAVESAAAAPDEWPGGRRASLRAGGRLAAMLGDLALQCTLPWRVRGGYDALVVRDKPVLGAIGWLAARAARVPFCYWMSYPLPEHYLWLAGQPGMGRLRRAWLRLRGRAGLACLRRLLVPRSDWLFVQTDAMERVQRAHGGLDHDRVTAVPMGVDVGAIPPPAPLPEPLRGRRVAVYLGTLDRARRPEILVDAAMIVARHHPDFTMLIIGEADEPSDRGWLRAYAERIGAGDAVHFTGRVPFATGLGMARNAVVGLSPVPRTDLTEVGSPTKAIEYLACGVPVIANDQPDQALVVGQGGGGLIAGLDAESFARAILELLDDPDRARAYAESGRRWVAAHRTYEILGGLVADTLRRVATHAARRA